MRSYHLPSIEPNVLPRDKSSSYVGLNKPIASSVLRCDEPREWTSLEGCENGRGVQSIQLVTFMDRLDTTDMFRSF